MISEIAAEIIEKFQHQSGSLIIAVGGPGGSGKSTFAENLSEHLESSNILKVDNYRKSRKEREGTGLLGSDPEANNIELLLEHLKFIKENKQFEQPVYNEVTGDIDNTIIYKPANFNIIDGELGLYEHVIEHADFVIVIKCGLFTLLKDRLMRDKKKRSYSLLKSIKVFVHSTIVDFNKYYKPNMNDADIILFRSGNNFSVMKDNS